jgi:hypothetical protein
MSQPQSRPNGPDGSSVSEPQARPIATDATFEFGRFRAEALDLLATVPTENRLRRRRYGVALPAQQLLASMEDR